MWPWEHLAFGYVLYSLVCRARGRSPAGAATVAVAVGTQFPDLVDKPLSWTFGVFPTGYSVAHSAFFAPIVVGLAYALTARAGRVGLGAAFSVGYLSHLAGDIVYPAIVGNGLSPDSVLWPLAHSAGTPPEAGLFELFERYFSAWAAQILTLDPSPLLLFELALAALVFALWVLDGMPILAELRAALAGPARR
jgi:hypothetical protein